MTTTLAALTNHQIRLAARPNGLPRRDGWKFTTEPVAEPADGGVLVKTLSLSLDPAMRGWMNEGKSYIPPVEIGEVMDGGTRVLMIIDAPDDLGAGGVGEDRTVAERAGAETLSQFAQAGLDVIACEVMIHFAGVAAKLCLLFNQVYGEALAGGRERGGHTGDAAADDEDVYLVHSCAPLSGAPPWVVIFMPALTGVTHVRTLA